MGVVTNLNSAVNTRVQAVLGSGYSELKHITDIARNNFRGTENRYGVKAGSIDEVGGVNRYYTMDQRFEIIITNGYSANSISSTDIQTQSISLMDKTHDVYKDLVNSKAGLPGTVMNVRDLSVQDPEIVDKAVVIRMECIITYRIAL